MIYLRNVDVVVRPAVGSPQTIEVTISWVVIGEDGLRRLIGALNEVGDVWDGDLPGTMPGDFFGVPLRGDRS